MRNKSTSIAVFAVASLLAAAFALLGKCAYDRNLRRIDSEAMSLGAEDVARRIRETRDNLVRITELYNESAIYSARSLARIVADDPSILRDRARFSSLKEVLGVDELHVSDSNGVLIACEPESSLGYRMYSRAQSAAFMPAITNRAFELVQDPMIKGIEYRKFQYIGVARLDEPGIVQIGLEPERLEAAKSIADIGNIASTTRVGRGGMVSVQRLPEGDRAEEGVRFRVADAGGGRIAVLQMDCDEYRIMVMMPYRGWWLADDRPYSFLSVFIVSLIILVLLGGLNMFGSRGFRRMFSDFRMLFEPVSKGARGHMFGPVSVIAFAVFALGVVGAWIIVTESQLDRARELLTAGEEDFIEDYKAAPDACLYFVGSAVTKYYGSPEAASEIDVHELMSRYGIDELNVVDRRGIVLRGDLASEGFDFHSNTNAAKFLRLLGNEWTYAQNFRGAIENPDIRRKYAGVAFPEHNGFVQIGFEEKRIARDFDFRLVRLAQDRSVGERGYCVLARNDGRIVSSGHRDFAASLLKGETTTLTGIGFDVTLVPAEDSDNRFFEATLYGEDCLCLSVSKRLGKYHQLVTAIPVEVIASARNRSVALIALLLAAILGLGAFFGTRLSDLVTKLRKFIEDDARRQAEEMKNAKAIQTEALPVDFPDEPGYRIFARMDTAKEVGGDFYDFYTLASGRQVFLIADTSGKGIPAAMFMMKSKAVLRASVFDNATLVEAVVDANARLAENNDANMFVTAWVGIYDPATGEIEFVNAGHNPPLVKHADGSVAWVRTRPGMALAAVPFAKYRAERIRLEPGDSLFLYTDGVTEAMNLVGCQYGEPRLEGAVAAAPKQGFIEAIRASVAEFVSGAEQSDDITMLSLERKA